MSGGQGAENRTSHLLFSRKIIGKLHPLGGIQYAKYKLIPFHCSLVIVARTHTTILEPAFFNYEKC